MLFRIGMPLTAAYFAEIGMFITDMVIVGRLGSNDLAAVVRNEMCGGRGAPHLRESADRLVAMFCHDRHDVAELTSAAHDNCVGFAVDALVQPSRRPGNPMCCLVARPACVVCVRGGACEPLRRQDIMDCITNEFLCVLESLQPLANGQ